jgi:hypothetical protein
LLVAALSGCSGDDHPPPPPTDGGIRFDSGDGGPVERDGATDDGAIDADAATVDGGGGGCRLEGEVMKLATDEISHAVRLVDVAVSGAMFVVSWTDARSAIADAFVYALPVAGATGTEYRVTNDFVLTQDAQLAARADGFIIGWGDTTAGTYEVFARPLDASGAPAGPAVRVTNNLLREDSLRLTGLGGSTTMAAWVESDGLGGAATTRAVALDLSGAPTGSPRVAGPSTTDARSLALSRLGTGAALAWTESGTVYLQPLTSAGAMLGTAAPINTEANASSTPSLALDDTGGAVAFGVLIGGARDEVRLRTIGAAGATVGPETILTAPPATGGDPSIARYATGYAVAYRVSGTGGIGMIRLAFATSAGEYAGSLDIAETTTIGGAPRLAVAADGRILVAWMGGDATNVAVSAAKVVCE